ncbi:hypothetical protein [Vibrio viridaestus]|uniref:Uncharacterized protein n=1 Tax=Vibrio viridaestus TaxID=2487322 RepID=A0A3N9TGQ6_9VIBR|nr:hypothetical protein [Vibrio viridaestus]RQW63359.1 hypothetical protein EES38_08905 [Vibrio viridaestus]
MSMFDSILAVIPPLATGALLLLSTVLKKGQICPGQRGRIHKILPLILILWVLASFKLPFVLLNVVFIGFFMTKVQTGKTREEGPLYALYIANVFSVLVVIYQMFMAPTWVAGVLVLIEAFILGLIGAHWMLTMARTRLQAFHKILPVSGIFAAMAIALVLVPFASSLDPVTLNELLHVILINFALLVTAVVIWAWHLIVTRSISKVQISVASILMLVSIVSFHQVYFHVI